MGYGMLQIHLVRTSTSSTLTGHVLGFLFLNCIFMSHFGLALCTMVAIGFKAKWSATFLVILLGLFNVFANDWWNVHSAHPQHNFLKYDFFQAL
ncbi:SURF4 family-domain-containing protein [Suillus subluteus]|nr:SURF4 family-domain-containing protein [Suillus subluteus]